MRSVLVPVMLLLCCGLAYAQATAPVGDTRRADNVTPADPCSGKEKVRAGETKTNIDGMTIANSANSNGTATLTPKVGCGTAGSSSTAKTRTGFKGEISGVDSNDVVELSSSNEATVSGTGGDVTVSGGSSVTVDNTSTTESITVHLPSGTTASVSPGSSVTFAT